MPNVGPFTSSSSLIVWTFVLSNGYSLAAAAIRIANSMPTREIEFRGETSNIL
jgi:hypothetical protein